MNHEHEPIVGLDSIIRCRTCGEVMPYAEIELGKVSSARMANRILDEIAIKGGFHAESFENDFIVYAKDNNGIREEVTARKQSDRVYLVIKKFISKVQGGEK